MSAKLSKKKQKTSFGEIAYLEAGSPERPPVLFVHGIPTSSYLWRHVLELLQHDFHCYAPDLMGLGDTDVDPRSTPLHMEAQAEMLAELMSALGHDELSLVCHDQGGAAAQIFTLRYPQRVRCFVITDCVCYDNWPVPIIAGIQRFLKAPYLSEYLIKLGIFTIIEKSRFSIFKRCVYDPRIFAAKTALEYLRPLHGTARERERFIKFFLAGDSHYTERIVPDLRKLETPTLIVWAADDRQISPSWGRKLFDDIPGAERFELVPFCGHFWQEERPEEFCSYIKKFLKKHTEEKDAAPAVES